MLPDEVLFGVVVVALQVLLFAALLVPACSRIIQRTRLSRIGAWLAVEALLLSMFVIWSQGGIRDRAIAMVRTVVAARQPEPAERFLATGDPSLSRLVAEQHPSMRRPMYQSAEEMRVWQSDLRRMLLSEVFAMPDLAMPIGVQFEEAASAEVGGGITRKFLTFSSFDGTRIPAYLFLPSVSKPAPAILVLHGHVWPDSQEGISQTGGLVDSYQHRAALELAKAGFVTLTIEFRGFGYLGARAGGDHEAVAYNALLGGSFYKAILCKDIWYALNLLRAVGEVDTARIGITGVSYGGEMAVTYAALDESIKVVVFQGFGGMLGVQRGRDTRTGEVAPYYYHLIPGHNKYMRQEDVFLLIAPRPLLGVRGDQDYSGDRTFAVTIEKAYNLFPSPSRFKFELVASGGHEYFTEPAIRFFRLNL
jgi:dienelactone hydrolase